ncbi:hypothetical protein BDV97DRAFT_172803 [Delphinella strobiligena]|nr:hypothetical protein BDV97DRAFT_172803 [Delphinella strobiligena]
MIMLQPHNIPCTDIEHVDALGSNCGKGFQKCLRHDRCVQSSECTRLCDGQNSICYSLALERMAVKLTPQQLFRRHREHLDDLCNPLIYCGFKFLLVILQVHILCPGPKPPISYPILKHSYPDPDPPLNPLRYSLHQSPNNLPIPDTRLPRTLRNVQEEKHLLCAMPSRDRCPRHMQ